MRTYGKIIGLILGGILGGWIGLIIGFILGHMYDSGDFDTWIEYLGLNANSFRIQQVIFRTTFQVLGYLAKADGQVTEEEIAYVEKMIIEMRLDKVHRELAISYFLQGKNIDFDLSYALSELKMACRQTPQLLNFFMDIQFQIAMADGVFSPREQQILTLIADQLGVSGYQFKTYAFADTADDSLSAAYETLGVSPHASFPEIKKNYRQLMNQNHPDKLMSKGFPPEMIQLATQKTQQIKKAYETLKKHHQ